MTCLSARSTRGGQSIGKVFIILEKAQKVMSDVPKDPRESLLTWAGHSIPSNPSGSPSDMQIDKALGAYPGLDHQICKLWMGPITILGS